MMQRTFVCDVPQTIWHVYVCVCICRWCKVLDEALCGGVPQTIWIRLYSYMFVCMMKSSWTNLCVLCSPDCLSRVCVYIYIYVCVCVCMYTYKGLTRRHVFAHTYIHIHDHSHQKWRGATARPYIPVYVPIHTNLCVRMSDAHIHTHNKLTSKYPYNCPYTLMYMHMSDERMHIHDQLTSKVFRKIFYSHMHIHNRFTHAYT